MRHNDHKSKSSVVTLVISVIFIGMLGTTIYSVGQMQKMKYAQEPVQVPVLKVENNVETSDKYIEQEQFLIACMLGWDSYSIAAAKADVYIRTMTDHESTKVNWAVDYHKARFDSQPFVNKLNNMDPNLREKVLAARDK